MGRCPFATSQKLLAGKWSLLIMHELAEGPVRFRELERRLYPITQATLTRALRQLEDDGLVHREVYGTIPPKVEYSLTEVGAGFKTVLVSLETWGNQYIDYMKSSGRIKENYSKLYRYYSCPVFIKIWYNKQYE